MKKGYDGKIILHQQDLEYPAHLCVYIRSLRLGVRPEWTCDHGMYTGRPIGIMAF